MTGKRSTSSGNVQTSAVGRAQRLIDESKHMTLATADEGGSPWASPVFYAVDANRALYWVSDKDALHSANVRVRPQITIVIYRAEEGDVDAVYIRARAVELNDEADVSAGMEVMARRPQPEPWRIGDISDVMGNGPWRIYRAARQRTEVRARQTKSGKPVVVREGADF